MEAEGGLAVVLKDDKKMSAVLGALSTGDALQLGAIHQVRELVEATSDFGTHRAIDHPDMRVWWRRNCNKDEVAWPTFWKLFPNGLVGIVQDPNTIKVLNKLLAGKPAKRAFQDRVERDDASATVSVMEIAEAFLPEDASLEAIVAALVGGSALPGRSHKSLMHKAVTTTKPALRCRLPAVDGTLIGREADATAIFQALSDGRSVAIIAASGLGKTQLALEVGWRLARSSGASAGAFYVDLREAADADSVAARFAAALGTDKGGVADIDKRLATIGNDRRSGGGLLLLVDSVEDALRDAGAAGRLRALLAASLAASPGVRLMLTSRVTVGVEGVEERPLKPLGPADAARVAATAAQGLPGGDKQAVVSAAGGSPLMLRLLANGLKTGRITTQVRSLTAAGRGALNARQRRGNAARPATDPLTHPTELCPSTVTQRIAEMTAQDSGGVELVLETLTSRNALALVCLSAFPSRFGIKGAAVVMGVADIGSVQSTLSTLMNNSLVRWYCCPRGRQGG